MEQIENGLALKMHAIGARHQLFIEPEGKETIEIYLNGFSTSLPRT